MRENRFGRGCALRFCASFVWLATGLAYGEVPGWVQQNLEDAERKVEWVNTEVAGLTARLADLEDVGSDDITQLQADGQRLSEQWKGVADALRDGKLDEGNELRNAALAEVRTIDVWRIRQASRQKQFESAPTDKWLAQTTSQVRPGAKTRFDDWVEARRAASDAWREAAVLATPKADVKSLNAAEDHATGMSARAEIARMEFEWINSRLRDTDDLKANDGEFTDAVGAAEKVEADLAAALNEQIDLSQRLRKLERDRFDAARVVADQYRKSQRQASTPAAPATKPTAPDVSPVSPPAGGAVNPNNTLPSSTKPDSATTRGAAETGKPLR